MMIAALVTTPAVDADPVRDRLPGRQPAIVPLLDPRHDEHVVVHGQAEQHHEHEQRDPRLDRAGRRACRSGRAPAVLEDRDQRAVRRAYREQVERRSWSRRSPSSRTRQHQHERDAHDEQDDRHDAAAASGYSSRGAAARFPPTSASPPGIFPTVAGTIVSCSVASACREAASVPLTRPAGLSISARFAAGRRSCCDRLAESPLLRQPAQAPRSACCATADRMSRRLHHDHGQVRDRRGTPP